MDAVHLNLQTNVHEFRTLTGSVFSLGERLSRKMNARVGGVLLEAGLFTHAYIYIYVYLSSIYVYMRVDLHIYVCTYVVLTECMPSSGVELMLEGLMMTKHLLSVPPLERIQLPL